MKENRGDIPREAVRGDSFDFDTFRKFFPEAEIGEVGIDGIPPGILDYFEDKSRRFISPGDYQPRNFNGFFVARHQNGDVTYSAKQIKKYPDSGDHQGDTEESTYFVDMRDDRLTGRGELRKSLTDTSEYFKDKPFAGWISTEEGYEREGLATRMIMMMHAMSEALYGQPLYSDTIIESEKMVHLWKKLVKEGKAKKFTEEGGRDRYVLIVDAN